MADAHGLSATCPRATCNSPVTSRASVTMQRHVPRVRDHPARPAAYVVLHEEARQRAWPKGQPAKRTRGADCVGPSQTASRDLSLLVTAVTVLMILVTVLVTHGVAAKRTSARAVSAAYCISSREFHFDTRATKTCHCIGREFLDDSRGQSGFGTNL